MITQVYPKDHQRFMSLPVLGPWMDSYAAWLHERQYTWRSSRYELRMAAQVCRFLQHRDIQTIEDLCERDLHDCYQVFRRQFPQEASSVHVLAKFLLENGLIRPAASASEPTPTARNTSDFMAYLREMRGYAPSTIKRQGQITAEFLGWLKFDDEPERLTSLNGEQIEGFIRHLGKRMGRVALQKAIGIIRNFLRFTAARGEVAPGLEKQIDLPRVYRGERLPRALPWTTVQTFLRSIDRKCAIGKRDYAMFSLMATYGLRACDVVALTFDDIHWRAGNIRISQSKTGNPLDLPLSNEVSSALYDYLKNVPRYGNSRRIFLRLRAPGGTLKSTAVTEAFQRWTKKSGLDIPFKGAYCLRHSCALNLLRRGLPVKTIGDLLGHRSPESTSAYFRLSTDDLRGVALNVPTAVALQKGGRS